MYKKQAELAEMSLSQKLSYIMTIMIWLSTENKLVMISELTADWKENARELFYWTAWMQHFQIKGNLDICVVVTASWYASVIIVV
jgi:hypothetical protein